MLEQLETAILAAVRTNDECLDDLLDSAEGTMDARRLDLLLDRAIQMISEDLYELSRWKDVIIEGE